MACGHNEEVCLGERLDEDVAAAIECGEPSHLVREKNRDHLLARYAELFVRFDQVIRGRGAQRTAERRSDSDRRHGLNVVGTPMLCVLTYLRAIKEDGAGSRLAFGQAKLFMDFSFGLLQHVVAHARREHARMRIQNFRELSVVVPPLLYLEILNIAARRWHWLETDLVELANALEALDFVQQEPEWTLVARWTAQGLTAYDAAYVAVAEVAGLSLVTDDDLILSTAPALSRPLAGGESGP